MITNFNGFGVGLGFGVGCGFGVGWGFGGMPLNVLGIGAGTPSILTKLKRFPCQSALLILTNYRVCEGGGCGVGFGLGWGFGSAYGSQYRSSRVTFQGLEFGKDEPGQDGELKEMPKNTKDDRLSQ
ncbi:hypothetical protein V6N13_059140 [Hibiscus sabdariffa]